MTYFVLLPKSKKIEFYAIFLQVREYCKYRQNRFSSFEIVVSNINCCFIDLLDSVIQFSIFMVIMVVDNNCWVTGLI